MTEQNRRKQLFANPLQREIFFWVLWATVVPTLIASILIYYLIFQVAANEFAVPEAIAYSLIPAAHKVTTIMICVTPLAVIALMILAYKVTHQLLGPFARILRELDDRLDGVKTGPIVIRQSDKFTPLVTRINKLLEKTAG